MEFIRRAEVAISRRPLRLGILAGSFNPPTIAHLHLLEAARGQVDQLLCVIPRVFPHKIYHGATLEQRVEMLKASGLPMECSIAVSDGGLFAEIAEECRKAYADPILPFFACGRDAAERIVEWDYGRDGAIDELLQQFELLVARRGGPYTPPDRIQHRIHRLPVEIDLEDVSSTEIRDRIASGAPWEHLVANPIIGTVRKIYS